MKKAFFILAALALAAGGCKTATKQQQTETITETCLIEAGGCEGDCYCSEDIGWYAMIAAEKIEKLGVKRISKPDEKRYLSFALDNGENHIVDTKGYCFGSDALLYEKGKKPIPVNTFGLGFGFDGDEKEWKKIAEYLGMKESEVMKMIAEKDAAEETASPEATAEFLLPPVVDLYQYQKEHRPAQSDFRFWGWSKDGKVAYTYDESDGGETSTTLIIFNFVNDENIWYKSVPREWSDNGDLKPINAADYKEFKNARKANGIEFTQAQYRKLPLTHNNRTYDVVMEIVKREHPDDSDVLLVDNYKIIVELDGKMKIVHKAEYGKGSDCYNVFPLGYFISPFENRALLVTGRHIVGGHVFTVFVGFDLEGGFTAAAVKFAVAEATERTHQGGFVFEDEGAGANIALTPNGTVTDFRYVSIGFNDDVFTVEGTLFQRAYIAGGQSFNAAWQASTVPRRGISYMDGGKRKYFYLREDGMDGSIGLVEFFPK